LDLLGDQFDIETIGAGPPATQQFRLFLGPGVEIVVVERAVCRSHCRESIMSWCEPKSPPSPKQRTKTERTLPTGSARRYIRSHRRTAGTRADGNRRLDLATDLGHEIPAERPVRRAGRPDDRGYLAARRQCRRRAGEGSRAVGRAVLRRDERFPLPA